MASASAKDDATQKLVDELREALAAERAAAYAQLDSEDFEGCIEATDSALAALEAAQRPLERIGCNICGEAAPDAEPHVCLPFNPLHESVCRCGATGNGECVRPPVSPEVRDELERVVFHALYDAEVSFESAAVVPRVVDAILARFSFPSQPVYDEGADDPTASDSEKEARRG